MRILVLSVVMVCLQNILVQGYCAAKQTKKCTDTKLETWKKVNSEFHKIYGKKKREIKKSLDPVVIVKGNSLILVKNGKRESFVLTSPKYDLFKIVSHIPLAIHVCLYDDTDSSINASTTKELESLKASVIEAKKNIKEWQLPAKVESLQYSIIDDSMSFIDKVLLEKNVTASQLRKFTRKIAPLTLDNAYEAIKIELGTVDKNLRPFKKSLSPKEWDNLYVVILSSHMPRTKERRVQYFQKLLRQSKPGHRVIYYEGPPYSEEAALNLVATHILDREIAIDFYKDPERMHRDLLSDAASKYLRRNKLNWSRN